jgi:DNA-binding transcriptional ArsR family regulator
MRRSMDVTSIARIASLVGEAGRIRMLTALLDGNGHSASELAMAAAVSPQTASSHLSKLLSGGLIVSERKGRQRLFRFRNTDVAMAIEALGALAQHPKPPAIPELRFARTCYDHLAGVLAIALRNELLRRGALRHRKDTFALTPTGERLLRTLDIDAASLRGLRRSFARKCVDWTERHHHIGGAVGAALLSRFIEMKWLARMRETRAVRLTHDGERGFERVFGIRCTALRARPSVVFERGQL